MTLLWLEGPALQWMHRFKYPASGLSGLDGPARRLMAGLAGLLGERLNANPRDLVIPIPLHARRLRTRGFNPASVIAHHAFTHSRVGLSESALVRIRDTPSQTELDREQRRSNIRGAFICRPGRRWPPERVWLVDDVVTTGATLGEAACVLRAAGVRQVIGVGLARTPANQGPRPPSMPPKVRNRIVGHGSVSSAGRGSNG